MSNLAISKTTSFREQPFIINGKANNQSDFDSTFKQEVTQISDRTSQKNLMPTFSGQIKMPDGGLKDVEPVKLQVLSHEESVKFLQESGMTLAEAEEILKPKDVSQLVSKEPTPQEEKAYLMSQQVDAVARDAEGNIVARIYKDGSLMCSDGLASSLSKCNFNAERASLLDKQPNVIVSDYSKEKVTDFDLLKETVSHARKQILLHPELRTTYEEAIEFQEKILAA